MTDRTYTEQQMRDVRFYGDHKARLFSLQVETDPVTKVEEFSIFTDDGGGNGEHILTVSLADLEAAMRQSNLRRHFSV